MPYCPACSLERTTDSPTCPLDGRYYRIERCPSCRGERAPTEAWCIHCGTELRRVESEVVALQPAAHLRRALALAIDLLCLVYLAEALPLTLDVRSGPLEVVPILFLAYFAVWTSGGRRTIGQQVLGLAVLGDDREPLSLRRAAVRSAALGLSLLLAGLPLLVSLRANGHEGRAPHDVAARAQVYVA